MTRYFRKIIDRGLEGSVETTGTLSVSVSKSAAWAIGGFKAAAARFAAAEQSQATADASYALVEVVTWLDILSEQHPQLRAVPVIAGMTFARNRTHHQLASAIELRDAETQWRWRPASLFPTPPHPQHRNAAKERVYRTHVEGKLVTATLIAATRAIERL